MQHKPIVSVFANPDPLSINLVEKLLSNFCYVKIFSKEKEEWEERTSHISQRNSIEISTAPDGASSDYLVFSDPELVVPDTTLKDFLKYFKISGGKTLVVLPYSSDTWDDAKRAREIGEAIAPFSQEFGVIFVGDGLGPRIQLSYNNYLKDALSQAIYKKEFVLSKEQTTFYPLEFGDTARQIVKALFSFGPYGGSLALLGLQVTQEELFQKIRKYLPETAMVYGNLKRRNEESVEKKEILQKPLDPLIKESLDWLRESGIKPKVFVRPSPTKERKVKLPTISLPKFHFGRVFLLIFTLLVLPYLFLGISLTSLVAIAGRAEKGSLSGIAYLLPIGKATASVSFGTFILYSKVPVLGSLFRGSREVSGLAYRSSKLMDQGLGIANTTRILITRILGNEVYDISGLSQEISVGLDWIYKEGGFIQGEAENLNGLWGRISDKYFPAEKVSSARETALRLKSIALELPSLLGKDKPTTYLVLFQNNMELRPTGGFIGSFALLTFDSGRLADTSVSDVYAADGQLKGHVEPPLPIKDYLGEANWFLRDSNWDADFPVSAARAEWFLDKEMDKSVDGVVGVDLAVAKNFLSVLGPIGLSDFNMVIDEGNLYEKIQSEVEGNFFPGSYKKTNILTSLTRELMAQISNIPQGKYLDFARSLIKNLEERHIQVFVHNRRAQAAMAPMGVDGAVTQPTCSGNCYADWLGMVEANVGVNKANYFLKRSALLEVSLAPTSIKRFLTLKLENDANPALGESGRYKTYLRLMIPKASEITGVETFSSNEKATLTPEIEEIRGRKEAGVLVEVLPQEKKDITFSWEEEVQLDFSGSGEYRLYWRKQAGTDSDPISVNYFLPQGIAPTFSPSFSLTQGGGYGYNTYLTRDLFSRIIW